MLGFCSDIIAYTCTLTFGFLLLIRHHLVIGKFFLDCVLICRPFLLWIIQALICTFILNFHWDNYFACRVRSEIKYNNDPLPTKPHVWFWYNNLGWWINNYSEPILKKVDEPCSCGVLHKHPNWLFGSAGYACSPSYVPLIVIWCIFGLQLLHYAYWQLVVTCIIIIIV